MSLKITLTNDMKASMQAGDAVRTGVIRLLMAGMTNERIKLGHELSDDESMKLLQREAKQRRDSIEAYTAAVRPELAEVEKTELAIISGYLPQQLSEDDIRDKIDVAMKALGEGAQMGPVVGAVMKQVGASADGATVSRLVRERLSQ